MTFLVLFQLDSVIRQRQPCSRLKQTVNMQDNNFKGGKKNNKP